MMKKIEETKRMNIFIDSRSIYEYSTCNKEIVDRFLLYDNQRFFEFIRPPLETTLESLAKVKHFTTIYDGNRLDGIEIGEKDSKTFPSEYQSISFNYCMDDIDFFATEIYDKDPVNSDEFDSVLMIFIHSTFMMLSVYPKNSVLVTQNKLLLRRRDWLEEKIGKLNIMTIEEAINYIDLFAKNQGSYYVGRNHVVNKGLWYWYSFRTKIPHYHVPQREKPESVHVLEAFASRFTYLLMSIDEVGMHHYFGKDVEIMIPYHFNYFLSLATGIFDNLAIEARQKFDIRFEGDHIPSRISLSKGGKDFLSALEEKNLELYDHIKNSGQFRKLIHNLRELAAHKEGFRSMAYHDKKGPTYFLVIDKETKDLIKSCGDQDLYYGRFTKWGIFDNSFFIFLEPYRFSKCAALELIPFCDRFLQLMGFKNFMEPSSQHDGFVRELESFSKFRLGF